MMITINIVDMPKVDQERLLDYVGQAANFLIIGEPDNDSVFYESPLITKLKPFVLDRKLTRTWEGTTLEEKRVRTRVRVTEEVIDILKAYPHILQLDEAEHLIFYRDKELIFGMIPRNLDAYVRDDIFTKLREEALKDMGVNQ